MSKQKTLEQAEKLIKAGKLDNAIREYRKVAASDPTDMRVRLRIADLHVKQKQRPQAVAMYQEVANYYERERFNLKAIAVYKNLLNLNPTNVALNEKLGDLYREVGLKEDAVNQYYIVAGYYDNLGKTQEAMDTRKKILAVDPGNTTSRVRLAEMMQAAGETDQSLEEYERTAELLKKKNEKEALVEIYEKILFFKPERTELLLELCRIYFQKGEFKKALSRIESAPNAAKGERRVVELWCEALLEDRQVDKARRKFRELYQKTLEAKDLEAAARIYSRILQEFSDDQDYLKELAEIQKETGQSHGNVEAKFRQDFEKTQQVDLNKLDEFLKKK